MDDVLTFKVLVLQALYNLGDDATEYLNRDRLSLMRFLGLGLDDGVPDAKTIWLYREVLATTGTVEQVFANFDAYLERNGYPAVGGQIIDATLMPVPEITTIVPTASVPERGRRIERRDQYRLDKSRAWNGIFRGSLLIIPAHGIRDTRGLHG